MICEYAQILSTAHRVLDGISRTVEYTDLNDRLRLKRVLLLDGEDAEIAQSEIMDLIVIKDAKCYKATHVNHPCNVWAREADANYHWLVQLFDGILREYEKRYAKIHATNKLREFFLTAPKNIVHGTMTPFKLAMPDKYKVQDAVLAYQNYYVGDKIRFAKWTNSTVPKWFTNRVQLDESHFSRTR